VDASVKGVGLEVCREVAPGTAVLVEIHGMPRRCRLLAWVVRADPAPGGSWRLGCRLLTELPDEELRLLCCRPRETGQDDAGA
jgi:hypothetical protein